MLWLGNLSTIFLEDVWNICWLNDTHLANQNDLFWSYWHFLKLWLVTSFASIIWPWKIFRCRNILWSKKLKWYHHTGDRSDRKYLKEHAEGYKIIAIIANLKTLEYRSAWQKSKSESHSGSIRIENLLFSILTWNIFFRKRGEVSVKRKASFCTFYCWHMITAALSAGNLSTKTWQYRLPRFLPWYLL